MQLSQPRLIHHLEPSNLGLEGHSVAGPVPHEAVTPLPLAAAGALLLLAPSLDDSSPAGSAVSGWDPGMGEAGVDVSGVCCTEELVRSDGSMLGLISELSVEARRGEAVGASRSLLTEPRLLPTEPILVERPVPEALW